jgi:hypothetical protein
MKSVAHSYPKPKVERAKVDWHGQDVTFSVAHSTLHSLHSSDGVHRSPERHGTPTAKTTTRTLTMTSCELDEINKQQEKRRMKGIPKGQTHRFAAKLVASRRAFNMGSLSGIYRKKWKGSQDIFAPIKSTKQADIDRWKHAKRVNRMLGRAQLASEAPNASSTSSTSSGGAQQGKVSLRCILLCTCTRILTCIHILTHSFTAPLSLAAARQQHAEQSRPRQHDAKRVQTGQAHGCRSLGW